ncbi:YgaP-like transmembrane domain [Aliarcobacter lanthieri]|uniref:YgaP-like transmembrane domain n=1 Tax=Aliarcobacter lanthieri TaxID=1355374 RepID=UPI00047B7F1B|nr:YgaP-like transmembrane domain [Aliarcobacter lanthieri]
MNKFDKIRAFCRPFRVILGIILIAVGFFTGIIWFYLGIIPLVVGLIDFCPVCIISKKCTPKFKE